MGKHLYFVFPIENGLQLGRVLPLVSALYYHMLSGRSKTKKLGGMKLSGTHPLLFYNDSVTVLGTNMGTGVMVNAE